MADILPADTGWHLSGEPEYFNRETLYEYMNGGADRYLAAGFQGLLTCTLASPGGVEKETTAGNAGEVAVEVFRLNSENEARSLFLEERPHGATEIAVGTAGALGRTSLLFHRGPFLIKLAAFRDSEGVRDALKLLADEMDQRLARRKGDS